MFQNTFSVREVISNTDFLIFKKGIRPEWEDPANKHGGKWVVTMPIEDAMEEECEKAWLNLLLHTIGGLFDYDQRKIINGVVFSIRDKHLRISLWCSVGGDENIALIRKIGLKLKEICKLDSKLKYGYQVHVKALKHDLDNQNLIVI